MNIWQHSTRKLQTEISDVTVFATVKIAYYLAYLQDNDKQNKSKSNFPILCPGVLKILNTLKLLVLHYDSLGEIPALMN